MSNDVVDTYFVVSTRHTRRKETLLMLTDALHFPESDWRKVFDYFPPGYARHWVIARVYMICVRDGVSPYDVAAELPYWLLTQPLSEDEEYQQVEHERERLLLEVAKEHPAKICALAKKVCRYGPRVRGMTGPLSY